MDMIFLIDRTLSYLARQLQSIHDTLATMKAQGEDAAIIAAGVAEEREVTVLMAHWKDARGFISDEVDNDDEARATRH